MAISNPLLALLGLGGGLGPALGAANPTAALGAAGGAIPAAAAGAFGGGGGAGTAALGGAAPLGPIAAQLAQQTNKLPPNTNELGDIMLPGSNPALDRMADPALARLPAAAEILGYGTAARPSSSIAPSPSAPLPPGSQSARPNIGSGFGDKLSEAARAIGAVQTPTSTGEDQQRAPSPVAPQGSTLRADPNRMQLIMQMLGLGQQAPQMPGLLGTLIGRR